MQGFGSNHLESFCWRYLDNNKTSDHTRVCGSLIASLLTHPTQAISAALGDRPVIAGSYPHDRAGFGLSSRKGPDLGGGKVVGVTETVTTSGLMSFINDRAPSRPVLFANDTASRKLTQGVKGNLPQTKTTYDILMSVIVERLVRWKIAAMTVAFCSLSLQSAGFVGVQLAFLHSSKADLADINRQYTYENKECLPI